MLEPVDLFAGFDEREEIGFSTFCSSVIHNSSVPVSITAVGNALLAGLAAKRADDESTDFAHARFLIPWMRGYRGWAIFCDGSDMLVRADIAELWELRNPYCAVQVVKHEYQTRHPRKFVGTSMECDNRDYERKNWSSVMLMNCSSFAWRDLTPVSIKLMSGEYLHQFKFITEDRIGGLPELWNWLPDEFGENDEAKLLHFTAGIPAFPHYANTPMAAEWAAAALKSTHVSL